MSTRAGALRLRAGPLRGAAILAAIFIAARVAYRVLFHGAEGTGIVLLPLPAVPLPPPLAYVVLLGPVTLDGLWASVASALPIAAVILAFGVLNALVDLAPLLARAARLRLFGGVARALAVAWSTLPGLVDAARSVHTARRLRGERPGVRMLVPLLERTLERASAVAAALELRGYGGRGLPGNCEQPVRVESATFTIGAARLRVDEFAPPAGSLTVVTGSTGAGKSTLLRGLAGLLSHTDGGALAGMVRVTGHDRAATPPRDLARVVGVVLQDPREAFATERVREEIGLALQLRGVAPVISAQRVEHVAARLGVTALLDRRIRDLSAGEATLVALAAAVVEEPILLLVDEPLADLDVSARVRVVAALDALAHDAGICVVVAEHRAGALVGVADAWWQVAEGRLEPRPAPGEASGASGASETAVAADAIGGIAGGAVALAVNALSVRRRGTVLVREATLSASGGEIVALVGPNGAGKSSLLVAIALPERGAPVQAAGAVALVPDASDDLFSHDTVAAELRAADRRAEVSGRTAELFAGFLGLDDDALETLSSRHPRDLSAGQRRCLVIAVQSCGRPGVLMVDEPTRGLDAATATVVAHALRAAAASGAAVVIATHDADFAAETRARVARMRDGVVPAREDLGAGAGSGAEAWRQAARPADAPRGRPVALEVTQTAAASAARARGVRTGLGRGIPTLVALAAANLVALGAFAWPFALAALPAQAHAAVPVAALALVPLAALVVAASLDGTVRSAHTVAFLGVLAAVGAAVRIASTGVGGVEAVFLLLILAGRAFGARFGMLLGLATIAISSLVWGGVGPWTPFQMFACAWVGAGAGLLLPRVRGWAEIGMLAAYGIVASYMFGLLMNLWFWPFAVGTGTGISYAPGAGFGQNLGSFLVYSLVTSSASFDTVRAVTTVAGLVLIGRPVLAALRRSKPVAHAPRAARVSQTSGVPGARTR